jgi:hypothetical protein
MTEPLDDVVTGGYPDADANPAPDQLADDTDDLDWDVDRDGRMREYATDDEPTTFAWED